MLLSLILFSIVIGLVIYYIFVLKQRYQFFSDRHVPTPPFQFFFGHMRTLWNAESFHRQLESWTKEYGKIYGIYEGSLPTFVVSDPDFLREVFLKQFNVFHARKSSILDDLSHNIFSTSGSKWRRQRQVVSPAFSPTKLKSMSPLINGCIDDVMNKLIEHVQQGDQFNIYTYYKRMTMDAICRCAFGIDTDVQNNPENIYFKKVAEFFDGTSVLDSFLYRAGEIVPQIHVILGKLFRLDTYTRTLINTRLLPLISSTAQLNELPITWLLNRLHVIVERRQETPISRIDLLHYMLQDTTKESIDDTIDNNKMNNRLTVDEVVGNIFLFLVAGYETTATALAYATYELARHPDVLEKLQDEIDQLPLSNDENDQMNKHPDYDIVGQMEYMDMFISEILRMYPIGNRAIQRCAVEDTTVQGIKIDKGTVVYADVYSVHYDRELWGPEDPYIFLPERHRTKRDPIAFLPFGAGPRLCLGMRFALIEMKILLTRLLRDYNIVPGDQLEKNFILRDGIVIAPREISVKLVKRNA